MSVARFVVVALGSVPQDQENDDENGADEGGGLPVDYCDLKCFPIEPSRWDEWGVEVAMGLEQAISPSVLPAQASEPLW